MKLIWAISDRAELLKPLENCFSQERLGKEFVLRTSNSLNLVPKAHFDTPGVIFLFDAFSAEHPGLSGVELMGNKDPQAIAFLAGEPSPETAQQAFKHPHFAGFFPSLDRIDPHYLSGTLFEFLFYAGAAPHLSAFQLSEGKNSLEVIQNLKQFNSFYETLNRFVGRFGIDPQKLKKVLMSLALTQMSSDSKGQHFEHPFEIYFGIDPQRVILATKTFSKGVGVKEIKKEFSEAVLNTGNAHPPKSSLFPEIHHLTQLSGNLIVLGGSCESSATDFEPIILVTTLPFQKFAQGKSEYGPFFFANVKATPDLTEDQIYIVEESAGLPSLNENDAGEKTTSDFKIGSQDLDSVLSNPEIIRDEGEPLVSDTEDGQTSFENSPNFSQTLTSNENAFTYSSGGTLNAEEEGKIKGELERLRNLCAEMGRDIKRLMKERREPSTDKELRDAKLLLEEKAKKQTKEIENLQLQIEAKTLEITNLKTQLESAKKDKAA